MPIPDRYKSAGKILIERIEEDLKQINYFERKVLTILRDEIERTGHTEVPLKFILQELKKIGLTDEQQIKTDLHSLYSAPHFLIELTSKNNECYISFRKGVTIKSWNV